VADTSPPLNIPAELLASPHPDAERVSLARVLADPSALHGKAVRVGGFAHFAFEGDSLCLHRDDVEYLIVTNCVWLDVPMRPEIRALSDRYVVVEGVIDAKGRGHNVPGDNHASGRVGALPTRTELEAEGKSREP
jgi:hypothetical protein